MEGIIGTEASGTPVVSEAPKTTQNETGVSKGKATTVVLDETLYRKAKMLSLVMNQSLKATICNALAEYLEAHESELNKFNV